MEYFVQPKIETCYVCNRGTARPRLQENRTNTEIVTEAVWVCPNCNNQFKRGVVNRKPICSNAK